jgi:ATP-dependent exoDNAse (exonuclease V) alpha subunit
MEITPEIRHALDLMNDTSETLFITGKAGTGKSMLLDHYRDTTAKRVVVLAFTGLAAIHVRGQTIHSFFGFPLKVLTPEDITYKRRGEIVRYLDAIIIDEVSMVRADLMDGIDRFLRLHRDEPDRPFGGLQLLFFGDPYQLPPIVSTKAEIQYFGDHYASPHFFSSHLFDTHGMHPCQLTKVFRQSDKAFIDALNGIRTGDHSPDHVELINQRYVPTFQTRTGDGYFILTTTNDAAHAENRRKLNQLPGPDLQFDAVVTGQFSDDRQPAELRLCLRPGAQVMFIRNDANRRWVNGTLGWVRGFTEDAIQVEVATDRGGAGGVHSVSRETWEQIRYRYNPVERRIETEVVGAFTQFPVRLGWAITIHKGQGQTFETGRFHSAGTPMSRSARCG